MQVQSLVGELRSHMPKKKKAGDMREEAGAAEVEAARREGKDPVQREKSQVQAHSL